MQSLWVLLIGSGGEGGGMLAQMRRTQKASEGENSRRADLTLMMSDCCVIDSLKNFSPASSVRLEG